MASRQTEAAGRTERHERRLDRMSSEEQANWAARPGRWSETGDPEEFLIRCAEIAGDEVYVFTPKGEVIVLPAQCDPVDFRLRGTRRLGHRRREGQRAPCRSDTQLESGDGRGRHPKSDKAGPRATGWRLSPRRVPVRRSRRGSRRTPRGGRSQVRRRWTRAMRRTFPSSGS